MTKEKLHNITVRFTEDQLEKLRSIGKKEARPVANLVNWIVTKYLSQKD